MTATRRATSTSSSVMLRPEADVVGVVRRRTPASPPTDREVGFGLLALVARRRSRSPRARRRPGRRSAPARGSPRRPRGSAAAGAWILRQSRLPRSEAAGRPLLHLEGLRAEDGQLPLHGRLHHRDAGHDRDDRGHAGDDADQGQDRAQLVGADRPSAIGRVSRISCATLRGSASLVAQRLDRVEARAR